MSCVAEAAQYDKEVQQSDRAPRTGSRRSSCASSLASFVHQRTELELEKTKWLAEASTLTQRGILEEKEAEVERKIKGDRQRAPQ